MKHWAAALIFMAVSTPLSAATYQFAAGDADCFGLGGSCAPGNRFNSDLGGTFFADESTAGDPPGTDIWDIGPREFLVRMNIGSDTIISAMLEVFVAGADLADGISVRFGDTVVGRMLSVGAETVARFNYVLDPSRVSSLGRILLAPTDINDGYTVDYVKVTLETEPVSEVPLPAALPLLAGALGIFALAARRRKQG